MKQISLTELSRFRQISAEAIARFERAQSSEYTIDDYMKLAENYNLQYFMNFSAKERKCLADNMNAIDQNIAYYLSLHKLPKNEKDFIEVYQGFWSEVLSPEENINFDELPQADMKVAIKLMLVSSLMFYAYLPDFFIPNLYVMQFMYLQKFAERWDIDLPTIPKKPDYRARTMYYIQLCQLMQEFAKQNGLTSAELCAFLFDYELPVIKDEYKNARGNAMPEFPEQAWIIEGSYGRGEKNMDYGFWQASPMTRRGDILVFYEKYPIKSINSIWIAQEDGVADPFFYYYSNTYIGQKIDIPALSFDELRASNYFKNRSTEFNYVSKKFQDVSGWPVTSEDYQEIKRMLTEKGFNISELPSLYEPKEIKADIKNEEDVYTQLITPLLEQMGWKKGVDFKDQVEFPAGHGTTGCKMNKRPDYCLHLSYERNKVYAKVVIEGKYFMRNTKEIDETFDQCLTYVDWGHAEVLVTCDRKIILVYEKNKQGKFEVNHKKRFTWDEMKNLEKYNELKRLLS